MSDSGIIEFQKRTRELSIIESGIESGIKSEGRMKVAGGIIFASTVFNNISQ